MPNLAGFDLIIEVARMAVERELLNTPLATEPDGITNDTLVPPFQLSRNIPLPGLTGRLTLKVTKLNLRAQAHTLLSLDLSFEEGSLEAPKIAVSMLGGQGTVTAPLYFTSPAPGAGSPLPVSRLVLDFTQATSTTQLDQASSDALDQAVGATLGGAIRTALGPALTALFKTQGVTDLNFSFEIDSDHDSTDMMTLTAVPNVNWIDGESLGIFGYHRHGADTGNTAWKVDSDLRPAPYPGFPWYPIALLISPSSFEQLVAGPAIRNGARDHVAGRHRDALIDEERAHDHNEGPASPAEITAAFNRLRLYLDSPEGQAEIAGATPPPWGRGLMDQRIQLPNPFPATTGYIGWLSMDPGDGRIDVMAKAYARVFCGSVSVEVPMSLRPFIDYNNTIRPGPIERGEPHTDPHADWGCEVAIAVMSSYLVGPAIGSVIALVTTAVADSLAENLTNREILKQDLPTPNIGGAPKLPAGVRLRDLLVAPSGLSILGFWEGLIIDPHKFNPSVGLRGLSDDHTSSQNVPTTSGTFQDSCGGEARTFHYTAHAWDTTVKYTIETSDVPHPLHYDDWWLWHDGVNHKLVPGTLTFPGQVIVPDPPRKERLQARDQIVVVVDGSNEQGFSLSFRAEDANVPFSLYVRVTDGSGQSWPLWTGQLISQGITFEFDEDYIRFRGECAARIAEVVSHYQLVHDVPVWDKASTFGRVIEEQLRGAVRNQVFGGAAAIRQIMIEQPEIAQQFFEQE